MARQRDSRSEIARILAVTLLGCVPDLQPVALRAYDLTVLCQRKKFEHERADRIEDTWTVADKRLAKDALLNDYTIHQARDLVRYRSGDSAYLRSLPIVITHPSRSDLKEQTAFERTVSTKYLPRWGLVVAT